MRRIHPSAHEPLYGAQASREIERGALIHRPPHVLMARAGLSVARLARAIAPHARTIWVACGPGNNGGDGLVAATHLHRDAMTRGAGPQVVVTLCAEPDHLPADAAHALALARAAGVVFQDTAPETFDLAIDALLGLGPLRPPAGPLAAHLRRMQASGAPVLCVDLPSGLDADTGTHWAGPIRQPLAGVRHTLSLLTLKPGLFTANGRDQAGTVWLDDLGVTADPGVPPVAWLWGHTPPPTCASHATHKGNRGDVVVIGGQGIDYLGTGMTGAAILAGRAALHAGAGRVYVGLLEPDGSAATTGWDPVCPELMLRRGDGLANDPMLASAAVVCGCGGGQALAEVLPAVLAVANRLVLDADGLNALAQTPLLQDALRQRQVQQRITVLTPHPLEAARLLGTHTASIMADRVGAARAISERWGVLCVLKGSGTVLCAPGETPLINGSGNAALATAGTGDVLAGMIGAALAGAEPAAPVLHTVAQTVHRHGSLADHWVATMEPDNPLTADALARGAHAR